MIRSLKFLDKSLLAGLLWLIGVTLGVAQSPDSRPNILLIVADDLGYGDLSCYGSRLVPTPNIDALAKAGTRATNGYAAAATCSPSRIGLMTGRYQQRIGAYSNSTSPTAKIPDDRLLMPQMLKKANYHTAHIGKWHMNQPAKTYFDEVFHEFKGAADYFPDSIGKLTGKLSSPMQHGWSEKKEMPYMTNAIGEAASQFIKAQSQKQEPFFLSLAFNAPHSPWQAPLESKKEFSHIKSEVMQLYAAMVQSLDQNVGRVLRQLEESGMAGNTLVVFISDNGPEWGRNYPAFNWRANWPDQIVGSAGPLSGRKADFLEGGIRVPFILRWPGVLKPNSLYERPISALDLYETFRILVKDVAADLDGVDLIPYLTGRKKEDAHPALFWQGGEKAPVYARMGDWKIMAPLDATSPQLFNLAQDVAEKQNLASQYPDIVKQMLGLVNQWKQIIKPTEPTKRND